MKEKERKKENKKICIERRNGGQTKWNEKGTGTWRKEGKRERGRKEGGRDRENTRTGIRPR